LVIGIPVLEQVWRIGGGDRGRSITVGIRWVCCIVRGGGGDEAVGRGEGGEGGGACLVVRGKRRIVVLVSICVITRLGRVGMVGDTALAMMEVSQ